MTTGRPPSVATLERRLEATRKELTFELRFPHPSKGWHRYKLKVLEHKITVLVEKIRNFGKEG